MPKKFTKFEKKSKLKRFYIKCLLKFENLMVPKYNISMGVTGFSMAI